GERGAQPLALVPIRYPLGARVAVERGARSVGDIAGVPARRREADRPGTEQRLVDLVVAGGDVQVDRAAQNEPCPSGNLEPPDDPRLLACTVRREPPCP